MGAAWEQAWQLEQETESSHLELREQSREGELETGQDCSRQHASSCKAAFPTPPQTVPPTKGKVFK